MLRWIIILFVPAIGWGQTQTIDTLFYPEGEISSLRYYLRVATPDLTKAELFQRGLTPQSDLDSIQIIVKTLYYDRNGERLPEVGSELRQLWDKTPRRADSWRKQITTSASSASFAITGAPSQLSGRIGDRLRDTFKVINFSDSTLQLTVSVDDSTHSIPTSISLAPRSWVNLPLNLIATPGARRITCTLTDVGAGHVQQRNVTVVGYDLRDEYFAASPPLQPTLHLRPRPYLLLRLRGGKKLLTVQYEDGRVRQIPVGRGIDQLPIKDWVSGDYTLQLTDLGTRDRVYARIRVE